MKTYKSIILTSAVAVLTGCAAFKERPPIPQEGIIAMVKAGTAPGDVIQKLRASGTVYELTATELVELSKKGVPDSVLNYMQSTQIQAVRQEEARRNFYYPSPYPYYWYDRRHGYSPWWY